MRLDLASELPDFRDNLESRLILLKRRLDERDAPIRIEKTGRARFRLVVTAPLELDLVATNEDEPTRKVPGGSRPPGTLRFEIAGSRLHRGLVVVDDRAGRRSLGMPALVGFDRLTLNVSFGSAVVSPPTATVNVLPSRPRRTSPCRTLA